MNQEIFKIYQNKIILEPTEFDNDNYYYFYGTDGKIFGIEKSISENEYKLIKSFYLEKNIKNLNKKTEAIYNYIYEGESYPFNKKVNFLLYKANESKTQINNLLKDVLLNVVEFSIDNVEVIFYEDEQQAELDDLFQTMSDDFGYSINVHSGLRLNKNVKGSFVAHYISCIVNTNFFGKTYSDLIDIIFSNDSSKIYPLIKEIKTYVLDPVLKKNNNLETLDAFFKNDLNVSQTAKALYLNRNSLINRLDTISKEIGIDVQSFKYAACILIMINLV